MTEAEMDAALEAGAPGMTGIVVGREAFEAIAYENVMAWDAMREALSALGVDVPAIPFPVGGAQ